MDNDNLLNLTEKGQEQYQLVSSYNLGKFYYPPCGKIIINDFEFCESERVKVACFLRENSDWLLLYEHGAWVITTREDLNP